MRIFFIGRDCITIAKHDLTRVLRVFYRIKFPLPSRGNCVRIVYRLSRRGGGLLFGGMPFGGNLAACRCLRLCRDLAALGGIGNRSGDLFYYFFFELAVVTVYRRENFLDRSEERRVGKKCR